jgi:hypothetical protein
MFSQTSILNFINPEHPIKVLADQMPWQELEEALAQYYAPKMPNHKPLRLMTGLLVYKYLHGLDDEQLLEDWISNPYFQYFTGETTFKWEPPFELKDLEQLTTSIGEKLPHELLTIPLALLASQTLEEDVANKLLSDLDEQLAKEWEDEFEEEFGKELEEDDELDEEFKENRFEEEYEDDFDDEFEDDANEDSDENEYDDEEG